MGSTANLLLMDKILHHQGWWLSHDLWGFNHPRWSIGFRPWPRPRLEALRCWPGRLGEALAWSHAGGGGEIGWKCHWERKRKSPFWFAKFWYQNVSKRHKIFWFSGYPLVSTRICWMHLSWCHHVDVSEYLCQPGWCGKGFYSLFPNCSFLLETQHKILLHRCQHKIMACEIIFSVVHWVVGVGSTQTSCGSAQLVQK